MFRRRVNPAANTPYAINDHVGTSPLNAPATPTKATLNLTQSSNTRMANGTILADRYLLERTIGKGSYGKVKLALDLASPTDRRVAIKFIARSSIRKPAHSIRIRREINLLTALHHTNIVGLFETVETSHDIVLIMEYVPGLDLFERIVGHPNKRYEEEEGRDIFRQLVAALEYCHRHRVIHRDLKPENVMVSNEGVVKLIDFGFANMYHPRGYLETNCGSPLYAAPEIVQGIRYVGPEVDVWSLGVILFAILTGTLPFEDDQLKGLYAKICAGHYTLPEYVHVGARDLIRGMLEVDPSRRMPITQVARHPWVHPFNLPPHVSYARPAVIIHPDEYILQSMVSFGFVNIEETLFIVTTDPDDPATSIYHLLVAKEQREGGRQKSSANTTAALLSPPPTPAKLFSPSKPPRPAHVGNVRPLAATEDCGWFVCHTDPVQVPPIPSSVHTPLTTSPGQCTLSPHMQQHSGEPATVGIMSQAAASVANHFRKLRDLTFTSSPSGARTTEHYHPV